MGLAGHMGIWAHIDMWMSGNVGHVGYLHMGIWPHGHMGIWSQGHVGI